MISSRNLLNALALTAVSGAALTLLLFALGPDWSAFAPATCAATRCFCELPRPGALVLQPANSWSSYGYAFAGFLMIVLARGAGWHSGFSRGGAVVLGVTAIFVGLGSVLLHATLSLWGQFFDVTGMYFTSGFMLVYALARWRGWPHRQSVLVYTVLLAALLTLLYAVPEVRRWLFALVLVAAIVAELALARPLRPGVRTGYYLGGMAVQATAFAIWILDQRGLVCQPGSVIQGHAVWHLLGAAALWLTFLYYHSEKEAVRPG
jgi:hypothetical protein